ARAVFWKTVVATWRLAWVGEDAAPVLSAYSRPPVACDLLSLRVAAAFAGGDSKQRKDAIELRDKESRRLTTIGTRLRLTQQSRYTPKSSATAAAKAGNARPWNQEVG